MPQPKRPLSIFRRRIEEIKAKRMKDAEYRREQMKSIPVGASPAL